MVGEFSFYLCGFAGGCNDSNCWWQDKLCLPVLAHGLYCLSGLCRPYGAKPTGISLYPPLAQWATVVTP
ncbi:MAG: hypothetical protein AAB318_01565, partial [Planctomycetota bacterium]